MHNTSPHEFISVVHDSADIEIFVCRRRNAVLTLLSLSQLECLPLAGEDIPARILPLFSPAEQRMFRRFRTAGRRQHWLGGRLAAKQALISVLGGQDAATIPWEKLNIVPNRTGQPNLLSWPGVSPVPWLSISHSGTCAAALADSSGPCGVDVQQVVATLGRVRSRFCSADEEELLTAKAAHVSVAERLGMLWSAKEACKKAMSPDRSGISHLRLVSATAKGRCWRFLLADESRHGLVPLEVLLLPGHCLAWTAGETT